MKPKTEIERKLVGYANTLPPIDKDILEWGEVNLFKPSAYYHRLRGKKQEMWCQCCGHHEPCEKMDSVLAEWECPHCGKVCKVETWMKNSSAIISVYMSVMTVYKGMQVIRTVELFRDNSGKASTQYYVAERYHNWITEKGAEIITSRPYHRSSWYMHWEAGPYEIKKHNQRCSGYYYYDDLFAVEHNYQYPKIELAVYMRKKGIGKVLVKHLVKGKGSFTNALSRWIKEPYYETLYKQDRGLFWYFIKCYGRSLANYKEQVKIARRHHYKFEDITMWLDYVDELKQLGLDTHSPHYLCPSNLVEAHARTTARIERKKQALELVVELPKIEKAEPDYAKHIKPYLALCFKVKDIEVKVLPTVKSVWEEGARMHHCIYRMGYYKRSDTLLLSARHATTGRRIESIEVNLKSYKVMQSRGLQNKITEEHNTILQLMADNMHTIETINKKRKAI